MSGVAFWGLIQVFGGDGGVLSEWNSEAGAFIWLASMLFGAVVSATDPVAVVALLKELGASKKLGTLIEGESLLNDGTAIGVLGNNHTNHNENDHICHECNQFPKFMHEVFDFRTDSGSSNSRHYNSKGNKSKHAGDMKEVLTNEKYGVRSHQNNGYFNHWIIEYFLDPKNRNQSKKNSN